MVLKGLLCLSAARSAECCSCCHTCASTGSVAAMSSTTTTTSTTATAGQFCHYGGLACCRKVASCSRGLIGNAGASGQGSYCCSSIGKLPCFTVCPKFTTFSAISLIGLSTFLLFQQEVNVILTWLLESGDAESFLLFLVLFVFLSFPMTWGYILVNVVAGYRFGPAFGTFVVIVAVAIGSVCALLVCRTLLSSLIRHNLMNEKLETIVRVVEGDHGFHVIALTRLTPIPFGIQNGVFALSNVRVSTFMLASFLGLLPTQFLNSYMGSSLRSVQDIKDQQSSSVLLMAQVVLSMVLSAYVLRVAQRELHRKLEMHQGTISNVLPDKTISATQQGDDKCGSVGNGYTTLDSSTAEVIPSYLSKCNGDHDIYVV